MYQMGFLHRDVSISNALMLSNTENSDRKPFKISNLLRQANAADTLLSTLLPSSTSIFSSPDISSLTAAFQRPQTNEKETRLETLLRDLGVSNARAGLMTDGDMSIQWSILFANWNIGDMKGEVTVRPLVYGIYGPDLTAFREHGSFYPTPS